MNSIARMAYLTTSAMLAAIKHVTAEHYTRTSCVQPIQLPLRETASTSFLMSYGP